MIALVKFDGNSGNISVLGLDLSSVLVEESVEFLNSTRWLVASVRFSTVAMQCLRLGRHVQPTEVRPSFPAPVLGKRAVVEAHSRRSPVNPCQSQNSHSLTAARVNNRTGPLGASGCSARLRHAAVVASAQMGAFELEPGSLDEVSILALLARPNFFSLPHTSIGYG